MNMTNGSVIRYENLSGSLMVSKLSNIKERVVMIHKKVQVKVLMKFIWKTYMRGNSPDSSVQILRNLYLIGVCSQMVTYFTIYKISSN